MGMFVFWIGELDNQIDRLAEAPFLFPCVSGQCRSPSPTAKTCARRWRTPQRLTAGGSLHGMLGVRGAAAAAIAALAIVAPSGAGPRLPTLRFSVFVHTSENMDSIVWTGKQFLYVQNTENTIYSAPPKGLPIHVFANMPPLVEETRCILSPGTHGWPPGVIFCHSPDDKIYEIPGTGGTPQVFATLPVPAGTVSDGALTWDNVGRFGYNLVAATGRSGSGEPLNGIVFTIDQSGDVQQIGTYQGPGVDEVAIAPAEFGTYAGDALLGEDGGGENGSPVPSDLVAMDPTGTTETVVRLADGLNPIIPISVPTARTGLPATGLYLRDDETGDVYFAPVAPLAPYAGDVLVAAENAPLLWVLVPHGKSYRALPVRHNSLPSASIEGGIIAP
jgi:hypothetical protein